MLELVLGLVLIVLLCARTFSYKRLIDDAVPMRGYLYDVPKQSPAPTFFLEITPWQHRVLAIGCHMLNVCMVYLLLGGKVALLFAVYPVAVNNYAWITGSYYACTTLLTLISFYFITHTPWWIGVPAATVFYGVALNTTLATVAWPFVFLFGNPVGLLTSVSLVGFLFGKRFRTGIKIREGFGSFAKMAPDVYTVGRFAFSVKLMALYLYTALVPIKLLFFRAFGSTYRVDPKKQKEMDSFDGWFWASVALIAAFIGIGFVLGKLFWAMWFLVLISAFCQIRMLGQTFAERYMYPAVIGVLAILAMLPDQLYWMLVGAYILRTHYFIPVFESNKTLFENGVTVEPSEPSNLCNLSDWYMMADRNLTLAGHYIQLNMAAAPWDYKPYVNFASLWRMLKNYPLALANIKKAKENAEGAAGPYIHSIIDRQREWIEQELRGEPTSINEVGAPDATKA